MKFGDTSLDQAEGAILAHSIRLPDGALRKGRILSAADLDRLGRAGFGSVTTARLEPGDVPEDAAAGRLARALAPDPAAAGLTASAPFTGRANLFAATAGLVRASAELVNALNALDEATTVATLADYAVVAERQMVATVKIIPYAAPERAVAAAEALLAGRRALWVAPFRAAAPALILTETPGMARKTLAKGAEAVRARLRALGLPDPEPRIAPHETQALAAAIAAAPGDLVLILAASATTDRRDVAPAAIVAAGGRLERVGMPVDPGNLLALGEQAGRPVLALPGCAKSPKLNGADWVLERLAAGVRVTADDIARMGVGGLLKEISTRPEPRLGRGGPPSRARVSGVLLAAGGSSRMGGRHKLLEAIDGEPLVRRAAVRLGRAALGEIVVVAGAEADRVREALAGVRATVVDNPAWRDGMATSIAAGLRAIAPDADAALIALADMPDTPAEVLDRLLAAFDPEEGRAIVRPIGPSGRPGNPVLFGRRFFEALAGLEGDAGARALIAEHPDQLVEIATDDPGVEIDLDTPEAWAAYRAGRAGG